MEHFHVHYPKAFAPGNGQVEIVDVQDPVAHRHRTQAYRARLLLLEDKSLSPSLVSVRVCQRDCLAAST